MFFVYNCKTLWGKPGLFFMGKGIHPNLDEATLISPNLDKFIKPQNVAKQSWDQEAASLLASWYPLRD